jgi:hypothetical protein
VAYAGERKAVFTYNPGLISRDAIRAVMEAPISFDDGPSNQLFKCISGQ